MMRIAVIGATGMAGRAIFHEAARRGHAVTAVVRDGAKARSLLGDTADILEKDAFLLTKAEMAAFNVVVNAFSAPPDKAYRHVDLAARLVALCRETEKPRLFFILGAGSLLDAHDRPFVETIRQMPGAAAWVAIPENQFRELKFLREVDNVNWVGVSPSATFEPGAASRPRLGADHLLTAADGKSHVTSGTMALAVLDEIEKPSVFRARFTVSD